MSDDRITASHIEALRVEAMVARSRGEVNLSDRISEAATLLDLARAQRAAAGFRDLMLPEDDTPYESSLVPDEDTVERVAGAILKETKKLGIGVYPQHADRLARAALAAVPPLADRLERGE